MATKTKLTTPEFRVSFPSVFQTAKFKDKDTGKYEVTMLFDLKKIKGNPSEVERYKALKAGVEECAREKWGSNMPSEWRKPFRKGADRKGPGYGENIIYVKAVSKYQPGVVDGQLNDILDARDFYPGCWAKATVNFYAYDVSGNKGVAFGLQNLMKVRDDEPFGGKSTPANQDFDAVSTDDDSNDDDMFEDDDDDLMG